MCSIITKIDHNKSTISYLDVVIRDKIKNTFTYNYPINVKSIKPSDKELEDKEKLEIHMNKHDKFDVNIHILSVKQEVKNVIVPEEYEYLYDVHNPYTSKLLSIYYDDKFNSIFVTDNKELRTKLIIKMREELLEMGYSIIPDIIISDLRANEKRMGNRKRLNQEIISSEKYITFLHEYKDVLQIIEKNNPILQIVSLKNSTFYINDEELEIDVLNLTTELLDLIL
jgi:hypothetical protein